VKELLLGKTKLAFFLVEIGKGDMGEIPMGVTRLMLVSSIRVGDEHKVEIPIGRTPLMLVSSVKFYDEDMQ
jgi:hypothetical protein